MARKEEWTGERKEEAIKLILEEISNGRSLLSVLNNDRDKTKLPSRRLFNEWVKTNEELSTNYAQAREERAEKIFEEILEIADDSSKDTKIIYDKAGNEIKVEDTEWVNRSKLRVDARKWMLGKMQPKKYNDRLQLDGGLDEEGESKAISISLKVNKQSKGKEK